MPDESKLPYDEFVWGRIDPVVKTLGTLGVREWAFKKIIEELGELARMDVRAMHGKEQDQANYWDEGGDLLFAVTAYLKSFGLDTASVEQMNRRKLTFRGDYADYLRNKPEGG